MTKIGKYEWHRTVMLICLKIAIGHASIRDIYGQSWWHIWMSYYKLTMLFIRQYVSKYVTKVVCLFSLITNAITTVL
jgi:hypothetical protein